MYRGSFIVLEVERIADMKRNWFDKKVLILGLSKSGTAAAEYLNAKGADCYITEKKEYNEKMAADVEKMNNLGIKTEFGNHSDEFLDGAYLAVTSPGIPPCAEIFSRLKEKKVPVISEIELAFKETGIPFIAVTGTNGKTTTTMLTSFILNREYKAPVCGNIGIPPTSLLNGDADYFVCEVSSFQLQYSRCFRPQIAVWMNFTPDHIDWHGGLENYFAAKAGLFAKEKMPAFAVFNALDERVYEFSKTYSGEKFYFGKEFEKNCAYIKEGAVYFKRKAGEEEKIIDLNEIQLVGNHNYQNVMASVICAKIVGLGNENIYNAIKEFAPPEHRCEYVGTVLEKEVYNDSKATNPEASVFALKSFAGKTVTLIAGGRDKNTDLTEMCNVMKECVHDVILLGEAKERFESEFRKNGYNNIITANGFEEAIDKAFELDNQVILLSPACASFDMFSGYEERGRVFKDYVLSKK